MPNEIKYVEPVEYFPKEIREKYYPELEKARKKDTKKAPAKKTGKERDKSK